MPWDSVQLLVDGEVIAGGSGESIFQPRWAPDGVLHYVSDRTGWWNVYRQGPSGRAGDEPGAEDEDSDE